MLHTSRFGNYTIGSFRRDVIAGIVVGIIAIPLGMGFAIASGVEPEYGIYSTIVAGVLISLFGGSKFQIGGPTGAFIPVLFAVVSQYGYDGLLTAGFMAGIILVAMGLLKLGKLIRYIPRPVITGFTSGIAVLIFSGQIANLLGLRIVEKHERFIPNMHELLARLSTFNIYSVVTGALCFAVMLLVARRWPKAPGALLGLVVSAMIATLLYDGNVATIGSAFGAIPGTLPGLHMPELSWGRIEMLLGPALIIAMLGGIESLLSAVVADGMAGTRHNSNRELIGQGIANIVTPLFGGIPATGAIARTAANVRSGAVSPLSGVVHGGVVLVVLLMLAPYASRIPLAAMAPVLMVVAWNMSERREFWRVLRTKSGDSLVLVVTFLLTVLADLTTAVAVGMLSAVLLFVKRMADSGKVVKVLPDDSTATRRVREYAVRIDRDCPQIAIYTVEGPMFFGNGGALEAAVRASVADGARIVLLRLSQAPLMDTTAEATLAALHQLLERSGGSLLLSGLRRQPRELLRSSGLLADIGEHRVFERTGQAIGSAIAAVDAHRCEGCAFRAFSECAQLSRGGVCAVPAALAATSIEGQARTGWPQPPPAVSSRSAGQS